MVQNADNVLEEKVGGERVTFRVYVFLLSVREASARDVFHECGLSSPSLALHHLEKLEQLKLAKKDENGIYHVVARRFGLLYFFHKTGKREVGLILSVLGFSTNAIDTILFLKLISHRSRSRTAPFNK
jgi:hypothetical protein